MPEYTIAQVTFEGNPEKSRRTKEPLNSTSSRTTSGAPRGQDGDASGFFFKGFDCEHMKTYKLDIGAKTTKRMTQRRSPQQSLGDAVFSRHTEQHCQKQPSVTNPFGTHINIFSVLRTYLDSSRRTSFIPPVQHAYYYFLLISTGKEILIYSPRSVGMTSLRRF